MNCTKSTVCTKIRPFKIQNQNSFLVRGRTPSPHPTPHSLRLRHSNSAFPEWFFKETIPALQTACKSTLRTPAYTETDGDSPTQRCSADVASSELRSHLSYSGDLPVYIRAHAGTCVRRARRQKNRQVVSRTACMFYGFSYCAWYS